MKFNLVMLSLIATACAVPDHFVSLFSFHDDDSSCGGDGALELVYTPDGKGESECYQTQQTRYYTAVTGKCCGVHWYETNDCSGSYGGYGPDHDGTDCTSFIKKHYSAKAVCDRC